MNFIFTQLIKKVGLLTFFSVSLIILSLMNSNKSFSQSDFEKKVNSLVKGTVPQIKSNELENKLSENQKPILLDTRSEEEFAVSKIKGAEFIDYDNFNKNMVNHIPTDQEIIVYCSVGYRSEKIGEKLRELGYTKVLNLYGGIFDWKNTEHVIVNPQGQETDSVHTYNKSWSKWLYKGVKVYE